MIRTEFSVYEDGFYFLYVTNEVRIETDGFDGLLIEDRQGNLRSIAEPMKYLTTEHHEDEPYLNTITQAVKTLNSYLQKEYPDDYPSDQ